MKAETPPIPFDECLSETETQPDVISSPAPFGGMMEEQPDSLWSTIDLNELNLNVFFTKDLLKLLYAPNLTLACITFFTIRSVRVLHPGNLLIYCSRCHAAWQFCPID